MSIATKVLVMDLYAVQYTVCLARRQCRKTLALALCASSIMDRMSYQAFEPFLCGQRFACLFFHGRFHAVANTFFKVSVCDKLWGHEGLLGHWFPQILKSADWLTMIYFHYFSFRSLFFWWPLHWILLLMPLDVNSASLEEKTRSAKLVWGWCMSALYGSSGIPVCQWTSCWWLW